jgi:hypothetical protein
VNLKSIRISRAEDFIIEALGFVLDEMRKPYGVA